MEELKERLQSLNDEMAAMHHDLEMVRQRQGIPVHDSPLTTACDTTTQGGG